MNNLSEVIKNLPPKMKEDIIGHSMKAIKEEVRRELIKEMRISSQCVEDITENLIISHRTGYQFNKPVYLRNMEDDMYHAFFDISEEFVNKYKDKLVWDNNPTNNPTNNTDSDSDS
jgi:hypothetical protein